ncbi:MAG TPA: hypothetical protein VEQ85_01135 [Lacipirellulaceae bacterium]|nr:hypothetical protein [Lacipirellulaceae bacterium]
MNVRGVLLLAAIGLASAGAAGRAEAQCGYGVGAYGSFGAWDVGRLYGVLAQNVPYYAAFPPVYYSVPVPRTYGYSPFAYPPGTLTPDVVESPAPLSIDNPFVPNGGESAAGSATEAAADQTTTAKPGTPQPLLVVNPFVRPSGAMAAR